MRKDNDSRRHVSGRIAVVVLLGGGLLAPALVDTLSSTSGPRIAQAA